MNPQYCSVDYTEIICIYYREDNNFLERSYIVLLFSMAITLDSFLPEYFNTIFYFLVYDSRKNDEHISSHSVVIYRQISPMRCKYVLVKLYQKDYSKQDFDTENWNRQENGKQILVHVPKEKLKLDLHLASMCIKS